MPLPDSIADWPEPFKSIATGFVNTIEAVGITTWPWEGSTIPGPIPAATVVCEDAVPSFRAAQQGFRLGDLAWTVRYYTPFDGGMDPALVWQDAYTGLSKISNAIGAPGNTLGGEVASVSIERSSIQAVQTRDGSRPELMVEIATRVKSAPH